MHRTLRTTLASATLGATLGLIAFAAARTPDLKHPRRSPPSRELPNTAWIMVCACSCSPIRRAPKSR